jgi:hypothetical protein
MTIDKITLIDSSEPIFLENDGSISKGYELDFIYNYYVQDEAKNTSIDSTLIDSYGRRYSIDLEDSGIQRPPTFIRDTSTESTGKTAISYPRYIKIKLPNFSNSTQIKKLISGPDPGSLRLSNYRFDYQIYEELVLKNLDSNLSRGSLESFVNFEESLTAGLFDTTLSFDGRNEKTDVLIEKFYKNNIENVFNDIMTNEQIENIKNVQDVYSPNFYISFLESAFGSIYSFFNSTSDSILVRNSINTLNESREIQQDAINEISNTELDSINDGLITFKVSDLEIKSINFDSFREPETGHFMFSFIPIGFLIKRKDLGPVDSKLSSIEFQPDEYLPIVGLQTREILDLGVRFGRKYKYEIRILNLVRYFSGNYNPNPQKISFLLASSPLNPKQSNQISTILDSNPNTVIDISFAKKEKKLVLNWQFPNKNNNVDITKFLIFQRNSIVEPFELLACLKFDNIQNDYLQYISGISKFNKEVNTTLGKCTNYSIENFNFETGKIICVVSVDAHGELSLCSSQFLIKEKNGKMIKNLVSSFGAPLQYPNLFLDKKFGGLTNSINLNSNLVDSSINLNNLKEIKVIPTFGAGLKFLSKDLNGNLIDFKIKNNFIPILSVGGEKIIPISSGPNDNDRIIMNMISLNKEDSKNVNIYFK